MRNGTPIKMLLLISAEDGSSLCFQDVIIRKELRRRTTSYGRRIFFFKEINIDCLFILAGFRVNLTI
jgi:hypothetical protein